MVVYQCEDTMEGIFTSIYNAYEEKREPEDTRISISDELFLFAEYIPVVTDQVKARKVMNTIRRRFGDGDYKQLCLALSAQDFDKAQAVYQTIAAGLKGKCRPGHLLDNLADDNVHRTFSLARRANRETGHLIEFIRFEELDSGILFARITAQHNLLTFIMPHFADRFPIENFMILDESRSLLGIHPAGKMWYLVQCCDNWEEQMSLELADKELEYQELFTYFCHKIAIKERENLELQRNMLPLRFRKYMTEFKGV